MRTFYTGPSMLLATLLMLTSSCQEKKTGGDVGKTGPVNEQTSVSSESGKIKVADQIIYDVEIINPNPEDLWTTECLEGLDHGILVDFIFDGIYSNKFSAYDIFKEKSISAKKIRKMEASGEFTRNRIGKFQFKEEWVLDTLNMTYTKKVTEVRMGTQNFLPDGSLLNYKPLLRVVL